MELNKRGLIAALQKESGLSKAQAGRIVELFFSEMASTLEKGERVEIRGLWSLRVKSYGAYIGRNPKTREPVEVKPKKLPVFKMGRVLRQWLNTNDCDV